MTAVTVRISLVLGVVAVVAVTLLPRHVASAVPCGAFGAAPGVQPTLARANPRACSRTLNPRRLLFRIACMVGLYLVCSSSTFSPWRLYSIHVGLRMRRAVP